MIPQAASGFRLSLSFLFFYLYTPVMLHGNSVKFLTGASHFTSSCLCSSKFTFLTPWKGNSHPELAAAVAER